MKRELSSELKFASYKKQKVEQEIEFKYESNKKQFNFNKSILESAETCLDLLEEGSVTRLRKKLNIIVSDLETRNKHIRIADRSPAGWKTVKEYTMDVLADDAEDEKRLKQAEKAALQKNIPGIKSKQNNQRYHQPSDYRSGRPSFRQNQRYNQSHQESRQHPYNYTGSKQPKPTDICRSCGGQGHWQNACPNRISTSSNSARDYERYER